MNIFVALIIGVTVYCLFDRWCVHREKMKRGSEE